MKKLLLVVVFLVVFFSIIFLSTKIMLRNEKRSLVTQMARETLGNDFEEFYAINDYSQFNGKRAFQEYVPNKYKYKPYAYRYDEAAIFRVFHRKDNHFPEGNLKQKAISHLKWFSKEKSVTDDQVNFEFIKESPTEVIFYAELSVKCKSFFGITHSSEESTWYEMVKCMICRQTLNDVWMTNQIYMCDEEHLSEEKKKEWIEKMKGAQTINDWISKGGF